MYDIYDNDFDKAFDEAVDEVQKGYDRGFTEGYAKGKADAEPTKHGRWIFNRQYGTECSECGTAMFEVIGHIFSSATPNYCPNCGAKMDAQIGEDKSHPFAESVMMGMDGGENG